VLAASFAILGSPIPCALAQPDRPADATVRVEVTGSRIARTDAEPALPVQTITREDIARGGWTTMSEILAHVSANLNGMNPADSIGTSGNPGMSSANLRGIGDGNTLVLLNGRRLSNHAFQSGAPDIDAIPASVVERVEILKDGASSVYGTDAIAGVVNVITRKDFRGIEVAGHAEVAQHDGGNVYQASATAGWGDLAKDRFNAFATLDWRKETAIAARDRPFATVYRPSEGRDGRNPVSFPANIFTSGAVLNPGFRSGCAPPVSTPATEFAFGGGELCLFDPTSVVDLAPATERWTAFGRATWQLAPDHQVFAEYLYARKEMWLDFTPTPAAFFNTIDFTSILYPANGPYYPTEYAARHGLSGPLEVAFRTMSLGPRQNLVTTDAQRLVVGAQGSIGAWSYGAGYNHSDNRVKDEFTGGYVLASRFIPAMATGLINPFGESMQEGRDLLASTQFTGVSRKAKGVVDQLDVQASRDWIALAGGALAVAIGAEARREKLDDRPAAIWDTGDILAAPFEISPISASRRVAAVFGEVNAPVANGLELLASVRHDQYSDFGGTTNPKIAVRWQPARPLLLRASWGKGFRAPTLPDLYIQQFTSSVGGVEDPVRCPITGNPYDCGMAGFPTVSGGNRELQPETSTQATAGLVWEPIAGTSIGVEAWHIDKDDVIAALQPDFILAHTDVYGTSNVVRGPIDPAFPGLPGPIRTILAYNQNVGGLTTSGLDVALRVRSPAGPLGRFSFALDGTYIHAFTATLPGIDPEQGAGCDGFYGAVPRWRHYAQLRWQYGAWDATLAQTFQSGYTDARTNPAGDTRRVGSYSLWDLQGVWTGWSRAKVVLGVRNLLDTEPPFTNNPAHYGFDPLYAETRGRSIYARVSYALP
jgi:iron complex outermembrane receptor protein